MNDRAYWISWYDLPDNNQAAHQEWLERSYIPEVLSWPGVMWAAHYAAEKKAVPLGGGQGRVRLHAAPDEVPGGTQFILLFGARQPHVFADPGPAAFHAGLAGEDRDMLEARRGVRTNLMVEEARVLGPGGDDDAPPAPAIQLGSFNAVSPEVESELATWYAQWRLPSMKTLPGVVHVRKLVSVAGWAKHACFYEFTSLAERARHFVHYEDAHPDKARWSSDLVARLVHATPGAIVARRTWPRA